MCHTDSVVLIHSTALAYKKETIRPLYLHTLLSSNEAAATHNTTPSPADTQHCSLHSLPRVIPVLFGWCLRVSPLHALVYILKTFRDLFAIYYAHLLPPLFFLGGSSGFGSGFGALTGGGSMSLSNFFSTSSLNSVDKCITSRQKRAVFTPTATSTFAWQLHSCTTSWLLTNNVQFTQGLWTVHCSSHCPVCYVHVFTFQVV